MAIWTPTQGAETNAGADGGTLFKGIANGSRVIQSKVTPANAQARAGFAQWGRIAYWQDLWLGVGGQLQGQWNTYAAANPDYVLSGRAVIKSGADHFASFWIRAELMTGAEPSPPYATPDPDPVWNAPSAPFEEFLVGSPLFSMVLATTQPDPITLFLAVRQPSKGKGNIARSTQRPLGSYTFPSMTQGDLFDTACIDAAQRFGAIADSTTAQQWFTVWQAIGGYARPLLDPCWTPPVVPPPPPPGPFAPSYIVTMTRPGFVTESQTVFRVGQSIYWTNELNYSILEGAPTQDDRYDWTLSGNVSDPYVSVALGHKYDSAQPTGGYVDVQPGDATLSVS